MQLALKITGFIIAGVVVLFLGFAIAIIPCEIIEWKSYCSIHGGYGVFLGLLLGCILAYVLGMKGAKVLSEAFKK